MNRRLFFLGVLASVATPCRSLRAAAQSRRKILLVCVDGFGPAYLAKSDMPNLRRMGRSGALVEGRCVIPSVTDVNNASIATGTLPEEHGITTNYYYDRATHTAQYMESADFLLRPTIFDRARRLQLKTAMVTSKAKLLTLLSRGAGIAVAAEEPTPEFIGLVGPKEDIYSAEVNFWSLKAARFLLKERGIDLLYLTTTDYMMHTYPPEDERSQAHLHTFDRMLGEIVDDHSNLEVYLSADHGMSAKPEAIDLRRVLAARGIEAEVVPIIKDKHVVHHGNLGGSSYVYLQQPGDLTRAMDLLRNEPGVEQVFDQATAAARFHLMASRIGDVFVLGQQHIAFGDLEHVRESTKVRSHGSLHEQAVPIACYGRKMNPEDYQMNLDISRRLVWPS